MPWRSIRPNLLLLCALLGSTSALAGFSVIRSPNPPPPTPAATPRVEGNPVMTEADSELTDLYRNQEEMRRTAEMLNRVNPVAVEGSAPEPAPGTDAVPGAGSESTSQGWGSADGAPSMYVGEAPRAIMPGEGPHSAEVMARMQALLNSPMMQGMQKLTRDPEFVSGMQELLPSKNHKQYWIYQIAFLIFMFVFRSWRSRAHDHWLGKLWVQLYSFGILMAVSGYFLPAWIYGPAYEKLFRALIRNLL